MNIVLAYSPAPREVREWSMELPSGATVREAIAASGVLAAFPGLATAGQVTGVWGKRVPPGHALADGDRVEIYRGLRVDPKVARRERFSRQGVKRAGLFAKSRVGAKAGY
ncbi:MAG: RnfH family protein [Comamonadaceae bacterium]|nr:MAG: RnfH family protein [Comamonadaceae bacterium]